jgi:hypothetical protein
MDVAPRIDSYEFGRIVIDGREYRADVIVLPEHVVADWWRLEGHSLAPEDVKDVVAAEPKLFIVGAGAYGGMSVPEDTVTYLEGRGIKVEAHDTAAAVRRYNEAAAAGERVAAGLHLTC